MTHLKMKMAGKKLLVIDDSLTIQKVIRLALSNEGYEIQAVSNGNEALEQIALFRPDVILMDHSLPGKSAFEIKEGLNQIPDQRMIPCLLMASAFEQVDEARFQRSGFSAKMVKPFDPSHLRETLAQIQLTPTSPSAMMPPDRPKFKTESVEFEEPVLLETPPKFHKPMDLQDPSSLKDDELWGKELTSTPPSPFDNDIRQLTESTIKMTGLDEYQWNLNEPMKTETPPPSPIPVSPSTTENSLEPDPIEAGPPPFQREKTEFIEARMDSEPTLAPSFQMEDRDDATFDIESMDDLNHPGRLASQKTGYESSEIDNNVLPLSSEQMEALVKKQIQETLEKMARELLPELAERLIKEEIQKMLGNPP